MIARFCLYGFLKNQKYFEPFLLLAFMQKGLSYFQIGMLIGFRAICINIFELPSGALADSFGRRKCMILSFSGYISSFFLLGTFNHLAILFVAMLFFAIGEAFRSGTHKAMIFHWLQLNGRKSEKTYVYGITRSWSQYGSAVSSLVAIFIVLWWHNYNSVFLFCIIPYVAGLVNFMTYPSYLDEGDGNSLSLKRIIMYLKDTLKMCVLQKGLRNYLVESMFFLGGHASMKDYIQPVIKAIAISAPLFVYMEDRSRTAILLGAVYFVLFVLSGAGSKYAAKFSSHFKSEEKASLVLIGLSVFICLILLVSLYFDNLYLGAISFILLAVIQNIWRPIYLGLLDNVSDGRLGATILSVDSQARSLFVFIFAPLAGVFADNFGIYSVGIPIFFVYFLLFLFAYRHILYK